MCEPKDGRVRGGVHVTRTPGGLELTSLLADGELGSARLTGAMKRRSHCQCPYRLAKYEPGWVEHDSMSSTVACLPVVYGR